LQVQPAVLSRVDQGAQPPVVVGLREEILRGVVLGFQ
jgi:hypothetical protein